MLTIFRLYFLSNASSILFLDNCLFSLEKEAWLSRLWPYSPNLQKVTNTNIYIIHLPQASDYLKAISDSKDLLFDPSSFKLELLLALTLGLEGTATTALSGLHKVSIQDSTREPRHCSSVCRAPSKVPVWCNYTDCGFESWRRVIRGQTNCSE